MAALLKLVPPDARMSDVPAALSADPWAAATEGQRRIADLRTAVIAPLAELVEGGASVNHAAQLFNAKVAGGLLDPNTAHVMQALGRNAASVPTLKRWISAYRKEGKAGLLPKHTGRVRQEYGWEARAIALFNIPSQPQYADVAWNLRTEGFESATNSRVKAFLKSLPATLGEHSPARIGKHLHKLTRQKYQRRHLDDVLVGEIYAGDGHTIDCYLAHPNTGKIWRPELTAFIDLKSRYIPGWHLSEAESAVSTLYALSSAMLQHNHVPAWLYIDRGAGYRSRMLVDECTGWYSRFDIDVIGALPGNPHGKGWIERHFLTIRNKHDKFFYEGEFYCGDDMAPEVNRRLHVEIEQGKRKLPTIYEYVGSFNRFLQQYFNEPMGVLRGRTPAQVWAELTPIAVGLEADAVMRPAQECTVSRQTVRLHNRFYFHEALALYDAHKVRVEYDLHKDGRVWVYDKKGRFVCEAKLVNTIGVLPTSRLEEQRQKRLQGQLQRLERKAAEARGRREDAITAEDQTSAIEELQRAALPANDSPALPDASRSGDVIDIDILSWRDKQ